MTAAEAAEQVTVLSHFIKIIVLPITGTLCTLIVYYIKEMRDDIRKLNNSIMDSFKCFAPKEDTERRIYGVENTQMNHDSRISVLEEWQRGIEHRAGGAARPVVMNKRAEDD